MEPIKKEITPDDEWLLSLNASCNRLSNQYLNLLKSASSIAALHNINNYFDETTTTTTATIGAAAGVDSSSTNANGPVILSSATTAAAVIAGGGVGSVTTTTASGNSSSGNVTHQHDPRGRLLQIVKQVYYLTGHSIIYNVHSHVSHDRLFLFL